MNRRMKNQQIVNPLQRKFNKSPASIAGLYQFLSDPYGPLKKKNKWGLKVFVFGILFFRLTDRDLCRVLAYYFQSSHGPPVGVFQDPEG